MDTSQILVPASSLGHFVYKTTVLSNSCWEQKDRSLHHLELISQPSYTLNLQFMYTSFKGLLLGTGLQHRSNVMSRLGMFPEGMKASEAKRGTLHSPAPIPFIPHDGKMDTYKVRTIKVQISNMVSEKSRFSWLVNPRSACSFLT